MKCPECGKQIKEILGSHHYVESGLENIYLENIPIYNCDCGYSEVEIPEIMSLHELICKHLVSIPKTLNGPEIKFIRTTMGMASKEFANLLKVHKVTVSRWENNKSGMNSATAYFLKILVYDHFSRERRKFIKMIEDVAISEEEALAEIEKNLRSGKKDRNFLRFPIPFAKNNAQLALELA